VITLANRAGNTLEQGAMLVAEQIGIDVHQPAAIRQLLQSRRNLMGKPASSAARQHYDLIIAEASAKARIDGTPPKEILRMGLERLRTITGRSSQ
jgi:hypothetical protein